MKNFWKKLFSAGSALILTASLAFGYTVVVDGIGLGNTTAPTLTCGTSPSISGNDYSGTVTAGTGGTTSCAVTFNAPKSAAPNCLVGSAPQVAAFTWVVAATGFTVTQTSTNNNKIVYVCTGL